jgi:cereblon
VRNLAFRSSTPAIAYQSLWPWRLCQKICNLVQEDQFEGLRAILPLAAGLCHEGNGDMLGTPTNETSTASSVQVLDPSAFSNWISSNMPLSQDDRLDLLEMTCTVQQLTYIIQKLEDKQLESILRCKWCGAAISQIRHVFSVGGSAGTTGAYVNEHGVVHQTVTLRKIDGNVVCVGRPETRESWFPGFNWQVAHCSICAEHLGWKFRRVGGENDDDLPDRPGSFWGFSSITTDEHVRPRRVSLHSHHRRALGVFPQFG